LTNKNNKNTSKQHDTATTPFSCRINDRSSFTYSHHKSSFAFSVAEKSSVKHQVSARHVETKHRQLLLSYELPDDPATNTPVFQSLFNICLQFRVRMLD